MSNEIFEISTVKQEFLQNMGPEYVKVFSEKQLEMSVYMLNEFCDALAGNNLVLLRLESEEPQQQYVAPPTPQMGIPPEYQQQGYRIPAQQPQYQQPIDPFQEQQFQAQQQVRELNAQIPQRTINPVPPNVKAYPEMRPQVSREQLDTLPPLQDVDLAVEKPKSFADKIREMRAGTKKPNRINPDDE